MSGETVNKIYHNTKDFGCLSGVSQFLRRAKQLYVLNATRQSRNTLK